MRITSLFWAIPAFVGFNLLCSPLVTAQQPVAPASQSTNKLAFPIPSLISQDGYYTIQHHQDYGNWSIITGQPYASILWQDQNSSLKLYITPSENMITVDVIAKKNENRAFKLPFITWNIKNVSVTLNKISDHKGWVQYSTAIYTQNIDKLVSALQHESPMTLNLSTLSAVSINTDGLRIVMNDFVNIIRNNNLVAPKPLALNIPKDTGFVPLDGMSPELFPLYQETNYYVQQCLTTTSDGSNGKTRYNICMKRNQLLKQMESKGWCWGSNDPDQHDKDKVWRKCLMTPKGGVEKVKGNTKKDFEKAKAISNN